MILDRETLKQGKTRCGRGPITDSVAHVVTKVDADLEQNQPSGAASIIDKFVYAIRLSLQRRWARQCASEK